MLNNSVLPQEKRISNSFSIISLVLLCSLVACLNTLAGNNKYVINEGSPYYIRSNEWGTELKGGDTILVSSGRTKAIKFFSIEGEEDNPIVVINDGGQVQINDLSKWGALTFDNCKYIKVSGSGDAAFKYGFLLAAKTSGLAFSGLSSDCEAEFVKISHDGFFGIVAKKDYYGNPPLPIPVFSNLIIHDCFVENATEGMYLGETKSPGMEFKHVRIYNNIVRNTGREAIQIANMVEDVEIYNNTLLNAGLDGDTYHENLLQIGDNTVASVYNNIMIGAPAYGIINMGSGNNFLNNNFIASCKGIFIDDRTVTLQDSLITIIGNFFSDIINPANEVIRNMNGENFLVIKNNKYDDNEVFFYRNYFDHYSNFELVNNQVVSVAPILFVDTENNNYALSDSNPEIYANWGAPGGPEYFENEDNPQDPIIEQIILSADMIVDEVAGGSYWTADYLVDEQDNTPENGLHPTSQSWKPFYNMSKGPYHIYIDLGQEYNLTNIALHDMTNVKDLEVSFGEPGNWEFLFTEPCNKYKTWKQHSVDVTTRYIRISMNESVYAAVNELILYGYPIQKEEVEKSLVIDQGSNLKTAVDGEIKLIDNLFIYQNPVQDNLEVNIPTQLAQDYTIEVFDIRGAKLITENFVQSSTNRFSMNIADQCLKSGVYIMRFSNAAGEQKALKFLKSN